MAIALSEDMKLRHADVRQAFVQADVKEYIYIEQPEDVTTAPGMVGKLKRSQASRNWHLKLAENLKGLGFKQCEPDSCLLRLVEHGVLEVLIATHVDHLLMASHSQEKGRAVAEALNKGFSVKDLGDVKLYMGCCLTRDHKMRTLKIDRQVYVEGLVERSKIIREYDMPESKTRNLSEKDSCAKLAPSTPYREAVRSLLWLVTMIRSDIPNTEISLTRFSGNPGQRHWEAVKQIL
ncbi:unnamed protein product, partial [Choristocarpus tenellus]